MKRALLILALLVTVATAGAIAVSWLTPTASQAASAGAGFGTWAPTSQYGWHGSMLVDGVHTYCIRPGLAAPTGDTSDHGIRADAAGLDPTQLTGINLLVSKYGQTSDPVQAASVGWAVKAIADWDETLHAFGYRGDSLEGAINWTFSALAPEHNERVQELAASYYAEATAVAAGPGGGSGHLAFTTSPDDPLRGTVTAVVEPARSTGSIELRGAEFAGGGTVRDGVKGGETLEIVASPSDDEEITVSGTGSFRGPYLAAVRHYTTPGGQDTAGPAGPVEFEIAGADETPRSTKFSPVITTQVADRYVVDAPFVDEVTFSVDEGAWPRDGEGGYLPVTATAALFRSDAEPSPGDDPPGDAVASLALTTDPSAGPTVPYQVQTDEALPGPGFYTAVWRIDLAEQTEATRAALPDGYAWEEQYGVRSQTVMVPAVSSRAQATVIVGDTMSDDVIVADPVPRDGLQVSTAVFRAVEGVAPEDTCTDENLVWSSESAHVIAAGTTTFTAPTVPDFGTYYWQETAVDADGVVVHVGRCGIAEETSVAAPPTVVTKAQPTAGFGAAIADTATVAGDVPASGTTDLIFRLYQGKAGVAPADACTEEALVAETEPVIVTDAGDYDSPAIPTSSSGTFYWIEELGWTPDRGERRVLATGACGIEEETTVVAHPEVTTRATPRAATGEEFTDTATVTGVDAAASAELVFFAYRHPTGDAPVCTDLLAETAAVAVTGDGDYTSPPVSSDESGTVQWVAQLQHRPTPEAEPIVLSRGECGEEGESTIVDDLAVTGASDSVAGMPLRLSAAVGVGLLSLGLATLGLRSRRSTATAA